MAEYKKKNVKKLKNQKPRKSTVASGYKVSSLSDSDSFEDIAVKSAKQAKTERKYQKKKEKYLSKAQPEKRVITSNKTPRELNRTGGGLKIIKGTKGTKRVRNLASLITAALIIGCIVLINGISPTGIGDLLKCSFSKMGSGSGFPLTVSGGKVWDVSNTDGCITVVSDTYIEMYNSLSKELISEQHKYSNPKSVTSQTRTLVYDQGATGFSVYDVSGEISTREMKEPIVTASIGRNGTYCVVTDPEGIAARVYVYDKNDKLKFKWESETDLINAVAVSRNGKFVVLATVNANKGEFSSHLKVFKGKDSKPIREDSFEDVIHSVEPVNAKSFAIRVGSEIKGYNAENGTLSNVTDSAVRQKYCNTKGELALYTEIGNNEGKVVFYNNYLEKNLEVNVTASPNNIDWNDKYIVCSKDYTMYVYDYSGKLINKISTNTPVEWFVISGENVITVNNTTIESHKLAGGNK